MIQMMLNRQYATSGSWSSAYNFSNKTKDKCKLRHAELNSYPRAMSCTLGIPNNIALN